MESGLEVSGKDCCVRRFLCTSTSMCECGVRAAGYNEPLLTLSDRLAQLDAIVSLAVAATNGPREYVRPRMLRAGSGRVELLAARHPCLERAPVTEHGNAYIPNDCHLDKGSPALCSHPLFLLYSVTLLVTS